MTDLDSLLNTAAGSPRPTTGTDVNADLARGRRALRNRRASRLGGGAFAVLLVAGVVVAQNGGAFDGSPAGGTAVVTQPDIAFVAYTGAQPEGFTVSTVPKGWRIQGVNSYALLIVPPGNTRPGDDIELSSFEGKLVVMLESADVTEAPTGTPISVGDREGVVSKPGDGYGQLHWTDAAGHRLDVQWPLTAGWSDRDVADFAAGVTALSGAKAGRG
jgi:hypothetical protein